MIFAGRFTVWFLSFGKILEVCLEFFVLQCQMSAVS
jgi:hypothetical protein